MPNPFVNVVSFVSRYGWSLKKIERSKGSVSIEVILSNACSVRPSDGDFLEATFFDHILPIDELLTKNHGFLRE